MRVIKKPASDKRPDFTIFRYRKLFLSLKFGLRLLYSSNGLLWLNVAEPKIGLLQLLSCCPSRIRHYYHNTVLYKVMFTVAILDRVINRDIVHD